MFRTARIPVGVLELALALLLFAGFFSVRDLPLVDLPQHALQISSWLRIDAGAADAAQLELNFRTPYLLAYPIVRLLCVALSVLGALKLVLWAAVVLQARALRHFCERLGHDPWLGLLGYPLGLGFAFCFGFVSFCAALPLAFWALSQMLSHREAPSAKSGVRLAATLALLLAAHGAALSFLLAVAAGLLLSGEGKLWQRAWPLSAPVLIAAAWFAPEARAVHGGSYFAFEPQRWLELPAQLVGIGSADPVSTPLGLGLLGVVGASLGPRRPALFWIPLVVVLLGYGSFPSLFHGVGFLHPRFSCYLVPALLVSCAPRTAGALGLRRAMALGVAACSLLIFCARLRDFQRESAEYRSLAARLPAGLSVRPLVFERGSRAFPGIPAHLHLPAYYAAEKGGLAGYSFAMNPTSVVRFRPGVRVLMGGGSEWVPERFDARAEAPDYDYFLVKSSVDRSAELFPGPEPAAVLDRRVGAWWGYRRISVRARSSANLRGI